jgi:ABC-type nitrate/sulfonate/bicarbonate transport system permease component
MRSRIGRPARAGIARYVAPALTLLGVLAAFEVVARMELLSSRAFPPMTTTFATLLQELVRPAFWTDVLGTLSGWAAGLGLAVLIAVPSGLLLAANKWAYHASRAIVEFMRPIPSVALVPLAVLLYGTGTETKLLLVTYGAVWPLLFQTIYGVHSVDAVARDTARAYGLGRLARIRWLVVPSASAYIATGLRIASSIALILAVTAELVVGSPGIGRAINVAQSSAAVPLTYALIIVTGLLGWAMNAAFSTLEGRTLHWQPTARKS